MNQTPAQIVSEFKEKLDKFRKQSVVITKEYREAEEKVKHHLLLCQLKHQPVNLNILASYPKAKQFIEKISSIQNQIVTLRRDYQKILKEIK